jgi:hypothetical protein
VPKKKVINSELNKLDFEIFKFKVIQLLLTECPGSSSTITVNDLIDRNIVEFCTNFLMDCPLKILQKTFCLLSYPVYPLIIIRHIKG